MNNSSLDLFSPQVQAKYAQALQGLAANTRVVYGYPDPVLIEGGNYPGIWLECGPLEGLIYGRCRPEIALANHDVFFHHQREDGYLPCWVWSDRYGASQIQMVVPIAATAWEVAQQTGREDFLERAYQACARWDRWLMRYRNTRGTGLCEMFCGYDTGHDNSPRIALLPEACPEGDARVCPPAAGLPWLAPDLSATVYGGRIALSLMARMLGRRGEGEEWLEKAGMIKTAILAHCYDPESEFFYDVDIQGRFIKVRGDLITRIFSEGVISQEMFERIYSRYFNDPREFWTPFPFPSISAADPAFDSRLPENSWGGASQALTALRAPRW
ncbi:MAG: alpha-L-rhamnosidase, partial [Anaerolineaceae bacterium]|nr:alpha-L-rhamnosidase [Anaerolineaceae bacterium]